MHASIFFADLKSIHLDRIYHHLYSFGNCGFFATMGKEKTKVVADEKTGEIHAQKIFELSASIDERFIDGLYYSGMIKVIKRMMADLDVLTRAPHDDEVLVQLTPRQKKKQAKQNRKKNRNKAHIHSE